MHYIVNPEGVLDGSGNVSVEFYGPQMKEGSARKRPQASFFLNGKQVARSNAIHVICEGAAKLPNFRVQHNPYTRKVWIESQFFHVLDVLFTEWMRSQNLEPSGSRLPPHLRVRLQAESIPLVEIEGASGLHIFSMLCESVGSGSHAHCLWDWAHICKEVLDDGANLAG